MAGVGDAATDNVMLGEGLADVLGVALGLELDAATTGALPSITGIVEWSAATSGAADPLTVGSPAPRMATMTAAKPATARAAAEVETIWPKRMVPVLHLGPVGPRIAAS